MPLLSDTLSCLLNESPLSLAPAASPPLVNLVDPFTVLLALQTPPPPLSCCEGVWPPAPAC